METMKSRLLGVLTLAGVVGLSPTVRAAESSATTQPAPATTQPAQDKRGAAIRQRMQEVAKELGLTDTQREQLKPILQAEFAKMKALREDQSLTRPEKLEKIKAIRAELLPQLKEILTLDQLEKWQKIRQERPAEAGSSAAPQP
jgi:hypothetical protein